MEVRNTAFECDPQYSDSESVAGDKRAERAPDRNAITYTGRKDLESGQWCKCQECQPMLTDHECFCCVESVIISKVRSQHSCITQSEDFRSLILSKCVLNMLRHVTIKKTQNRAKKRSLRVESPSNKLWRFLAYKQFVIWINSCTTLGKGNRVVIPSCVVAAIRQTFPEESPASYTGFIASAIEGNPKWPA
jgi:hypothetical protein